MLKQSNAPNIYNSLEYLKKITKIRLQLHFKSKDPKEQEAVNLPSPSLHSDSSPFYQFIQKHQLNFDEYIILLLALTPHLQPNLFSEIIYEFMPDGGDFPEFGGIKGVNFRGILPTGETALFILAGNNFQKRFELLEIFSEEHLFHKEGILSLSTIGLGEPAMSGQLVLAREFIELFTTGYEYRPKFSTEFPAKRIYTKMDWNDLILNANTLREIEQLKNWTLHHKTLWNDWDMKRKLKAGYRALFYGPPGTGKTLTASLLGRQTNRDVYKIDLSMVVSKYIGETEKNLSKVFQQAENKHWILFFDEADSIFGKRTSVQSSNDRYANQEVSFLLQRIEDYNGLVILASNLKTNIDNAFLRRFQSVIHFPNPNEHERFLLWQRSFPKNIVFEEQVDLEQIASKYEVSGAIIMNIVQHACLKSLSRNSHVIKKRDILEGIRKEFNKQGKTLSF
ncbi:MAG: ATP-binding protein [Chitinophagales bacterium]